MDPWLCRKFIIKYFSGIEYAIYFPDNKSKRTNRENDNEEILYLGINEGFTKKYGIKSLVYFEEHSLVDTAIVREKRIKNWRRSWKVRLIESMNPDWKDLYDEIPNY
jgi:predicted GIY-YIG superfamily endonuclease